MRETYNTAREWALAHEGGYVDHPRDPGGATNRGVTQTVYDGHRRRLGLPIQSVRLISDDEVHAIYRTQYWDVVKGDDLPAGLDYAVFDYAVNSGPARAVRDLQRIVGAKVDGVVGEETLGKASSADAASVAIELCHVRMDFLRGLSTWATFGKGWTRRVMGEDAGAQPQDTGVIDRAVMLADGEATPPPPRPAPGKAREEDAKKRVKLAERMQTPEGIGTVAGAVGTVAGAVSDNVILSAAVAVAVVLLAGVIAWRMMR